VRGSDALSAGLGFVPLGVLAAVGAGQLSMRAIARWGFGGTLAIGMASLAIGTALIAAAMTTGGSYWALLPGIAIWGLAGGMTFSAMFGAAADGVPAEEQGVASGLASTAQQVGAAVGLALLVAVANAGLDLRGDLPPATSDVVAGLRAAGWVTAAAALGAAVIAAFLIRVRRPLCPEAADLPPTPG
jgi:MFS family permease